MKTLVISDTHLTTEFEPARFNYLHELIARVDQVILNGDFFEGYMVSFDEFVASKWQKIFPLLYEKNTIYLYGNHDTAAMVGDAVNQFTKKQAHEHHLTVGRTKVIIMHGHRLAPEFDDSFPFLTSQLKQYYPYVFRLHQGASYPARLYQYVKGFHYRSMMRKLQQYAHTELEEDELLLTGHSHQMIDDRERGFINLGAFQQGVACYAILDDAGAGNIVVKKESYEKLAEN